MNNRRLYPSIFRPAVMVSSREHRREILAEESGARSFAEFRAFVRSL